MVGRTSNSDAVQGSTETRGDGATGRLVVVSNRVPLPTHAGAPAAGGLAVGLDGALKSRGGLWFGWSGKTSDLNVPSSLQLHEVGPITYAVTDLSRRDIDEYYSGFANRALWPICHYRLDLTKFTKRNTDGYFRVNEFFARRLAPLLRPDDVIWIHDYHFIPLASYLRSLGFGNRIGFFLHIPFPPSDIASAIPAYDVVLRTLAAYDLVGFQTALDAENFAGCLLRDGHGRDLGDGRYEAFGRRFRVGAFPIGIDTEAFRREALEGARNPMVRRTRKSLAGKDLIIGVDRLDYSKGIPHRIQAYSSFLEKNPGCRGKVSYIQITPRSRAEVPEYDQMLHEVAELAGLTNGRFGDVDWTPIRYINRTVARSSLAGLYRVARVCLVTPLRDGMNLVAKEFVAAQDGEDPGVLVLSRFAGAAHEMDAALLVNPHDTEATAGAIGRALQMPIEERRERWAAMYRRIEANPVQRWCDGYLEVLGGRSLVADPEDRFAVQVERDAGAPGALRAGPNGLAPAGVGA